jgi:hypothetical protein
MSKMIDMSNQRFGKLLVLGYAGSKFRGRASRASWHCLCDCGASIIQTGAKLREGVQSCGCASPFKRKTSADDGGLGREKAAHAAKLSRPGRGARK